ncbi:hypothetical protein GCM10023336_45670 [Streptomyces similanensis]|uniref:Uncharacterized protein n=1 Tax=Streptomyces similanensis TaxID=1274988 RepID=A0ABP9KSK4_9ACTN
MRQDAQGVGFFGEGAADPVEHRVSAGQDGDVAAGVRGEHAWDGGPQGRGPADTFSGAFGREQVQLAWSADEDLGRAQHRAGRLGEARPAVGSDPDDGDTKERGRSGGSHCWIPRSSGGGQGRTLLVDHQRPRDRVHFLPELIAHWSQ